MEDDPLVAQCRGRVGRVISGKWRLDALIGVGGMAAVYMATHRNGNMAAVKILHEEVALNAEVRERFLREAYIANKVNHPGTVKVLDDDKDEHGTAYIVMELLRGETIDGRANRRGGRLPVGDTLQILDQTLAVLEVAHSHAIVHRDLKPENLFMTEQGQVKVLDFGIARLHEEKQQKRTQTGLVMGTPAFMAPEQAMGRWSEVDARTDLWAMGATAFTLLTGLPVHEAETAGEMLIAAATRPARSLARVLHQAPFPLVALIDRALAYERDRRFPDAQSFRQELEKVRQALQPHELAASSQGLDRPQKPLIPATVVDPTEFELPDFQNPFGGSADDDDDDVAGFDPSQSSEQEITRLTRVFALLERSLAATKQYAVDHPEPKRRLEETFKELTDALRNCDLALAWNLTPYSFTAGSTAVWEPEAPWNRIPYQLFADGVRMMGFSPGLQDAEFKRWLRVLTLDPVTDIAPEDDMVTMLWDENLQHVFFQSVDSFAEGNQEQRARYEADRAEVVSGAHLDHRADLSKTILEDRAANKREPPVDKDNAVEKSRELFRVMARGNTNDPETAARVANLNLMEESPGEADAANVIKVDETTRALLAARLEVDVAATSERFMIAAVEAFLVSVKMGRSAVVTAPLRRAVDSLSTSAPGKAVEMILELRDAIHVDGKDVETQSLRETMTSEVLSTGTLLEILKGGDGLSGDIKAEYLKAVGRVLGCLQPQHFEAALSYLEHSHAGELQQLLLAFIKRIGKGNEAKIGTLLPKVDVDLGLALVRMLAELETGAGKDALASASQSPHALVRIEALGYIEGVSGPRLRVELRKLLEDPNPEVRLLALRAMASHNIVIAGPFLVLRIQDGDFASLPWEERRQALQTLSVLRPKRCEEVCMALLGPSPLLRQRSREETRELAASFLGEVASSNDALFLLEGIAKSSAWRNSKRIRDAATAALTRLRTRAEDAERRRNERKQSNTTIENKRRKVAPTDAPAKSANISGTGLKGKTDAGAANDNLAEAGAETGRVAKPQDSQRPKPKQAEAPTNKKQVGS